MAHGASPVRTGSPPAEADRVAAEATRIAKASATALRHRVALDSRPPAIGHYETPVDIDPFTVPIETKIADLLAADEAANRVKGIAFTETTYGAQREWKTFAASDGSFTEQVITHVGAGIESNAASGDEQQRRSYPDAGGGWQAAGYEYIRGLDLQGAAGPYAEEAVALLTAPLCPPGRRTIILDPSQLYLQVHESCGHPTELDRVYGTEASYAGTSFLTTDHLDSGFRYGSDLDHDRGRCDRARRDGHVRLGRRRASPPRPCRSSRTASSPATSRRARPRHGSAGRAAARCAPMAGIASRSSG